MLFQQCHSLLATVVVLTVLSASWTARAWVFEEHANIGRRAVTRLNDAERAQLATLWEIIATHSNKRLCKDANPRDYKRARAPSDTCIDLGMLGAISGDHSCSPTELWNTAVTSDWIVDVISFAAHMNIDLRAAISSNNHVDVWHQSNLTLLHYDREYLSRATHNNAHFVLPRVPRTSLRHEYLRVVTETDAAMNATAAYLLFHLAALEVALTIPAMPPNTESFINAIIRVVTAEAFAIHFLEDSFSAGHFAGSSGDDSQRMGTHDYYSQYGLDARLWGGGPTTYNAHGDSFATEADLDFASAAVAASLRELLVAAQTPGDKSQDVGSALLGFSQYATLNICTPPTVDAVASALLAKAIDNKLVTDVFDLSVVPYAYSQEGGLPQFKNEVGAFLRFEAGGEGGMVVGGPVSWDWSPRFQGDVLVSLGIGAGVAGITNRASDGLVFLKIDLASRSGQRQVCTSKCPPQGIREDERFEFGGTIRMPFYLIPGDLLLLLPFVGEDWYTDMATRAAAGGLPWRLWRVHTTAYGAWQLIVGRELSVRRTDVFDYYASGYPTSLFAGPGWLFQLPLFAFTTQHAYSGNLGGEVTFFQPGIAWETNAVGNSLFAYVKVSFDGRYYFARP